MNYFDTISTSDLGTAEKLGIATQLDSMLGLIIDRHRAIFDRIWRNQRLTPQQVLDGFGSLAAKLFTDSAGLVEYVNSVSPGCYMPEVPYAFAVNGDGTVTVGDPIPPFSESSGISGASSSSSGEGA